jgi:hypothetical protein
LPTPIPLEVPEVGLADLLEGYRFRIAAEVAAKKVEDEASAFTHGGLLPAGSAYDAAQNTHDGPDSLSGGNAVFPAGRHSSRLLTIFMAPSGGKVKWQTS